jgi:hypothetical protein
MRAKFVNEIRQDSNTSGLGAIGIGKEKLFPGWNMTKRKYPRIFSKYTDYSSFMHPDEIGTRVHGNEIEKLFRLIGKDVNDAIWLSRDELEDKVGDVQEFKNVWFRNTDYVNLNDDEFKIYYNEALKMGTFLWVNDAADLLAEYFFIIDK